MGRFGRALTILALGASLAMPAGVSAAPRSAHVPAAPAADAISPTVDLGKYAVNGTVRAAVVDEATGNTYLGGNFSRVGIRTGATAIVDPPDISDGDARPGPEVLGSVTAVFDDSQPSDPGFLIVGGITAINGAAVPNHPAHRIHEVGGSWVLDTSWTVVGDCSTGNGTFPLGMTWIATPTMLVGGGYAGPGSMGGSPTGLTVIDRATGRMRVVGGHGCAAADTILPEIAALPGLDGCVGQPYCYAAVGRLAYDPTSDLVLTSSSFVTGTVASQTQWEALAAYDLDPVTGHRVWTQALHNGSLAEPGRSPSTFVIGSLPGRFLVRGRFPLDPSLADGDVSRLLLVDAATGDIVQRWSNAGEQSLADGSVIGPASSCETAEGAVNQNLMARDGGDAWGWLDAPGTLCHYTIVAGALHSAAVGSVTIGFVPGRRLPLEPYHGSDGHTYLVGSDAAVDVTSSTLTSWNADPAMDPTGQFPSVIVVDGAIVIGGDFRFVRGTPSPGIAAFDPTMAPLPGFASPLAIPEPQGGANALILSQGRLVVGGAQLGPAGRTSLLAVDAGSGALDPWQPADPLPLTVNSIVLTADHGFWVGGGSESASLTVALQRYADLDSGGALLAAPAIGCLTAPRVNGGAEVPMCGQDSTGFARVTALLLDDAGRLILAGAFGSVAGNARRGLAMIDLDGSVAPWNPDLAGIVPVSDAGGLEDLSPHAMAILGDRLVVGGRFMGVEPSDGGGFHLTPISPLLVFSLSSGALGRPSDPARTPWFLVNGWWQAAWSMAQTDAGLAVALGQQGMGIFDATTLDFDATASAPFFNETWMPTNVESGIFALAVPYGAPPAPAAPSPGGPSPVRAPTPVSTKLVMAGVIPRWQNRVAGNVVRTTIGADVTAPTATGPRPVTATGRAATTTAVPVRMVWTGADTHGSGVARYIVQRRIDGGAWTTVSSNALSPALDVSLRPGHRFQFRTKAVDYAGNYGAVWAYGTAFTPQIVQETSTAIRYSTGWAPASNVNYLGGSVKGRSVIGAAASYTFSGRSVGFVTTMGPLRGRVKVYIDGAYVRTVDLYAPANRFRTIAFSWGWSALGTHTIRLVLAGPSSRPRVDVDAFVIFR